MCYFSCSTNTSSSTKLFDDETYGVTATSKFNGTSTVGILLFISLSVLVLVRQIQVTTFERILCTIEIIGVVQVPSKSS